MTSKGTIIVTGASQGIGAGVVQEFLDRGYNVVANSRNITSSGTLRRDWRGQSASRNAYRT